MDKVGDYAILSHKPMEFSMPERFFPAVFVLLWASAFIAAKFGLTGAGPFSFLFTRFVIVAGLFGVMAWWMGSAMPSPGQWPALVIAGVLMHGFYLGGVFFSISHGTPAGIASLIVSVQPVITCLIALVFLKERISPLQWLGIALGMAGVVAVIWPRLGGAVPLIGLFSCSISVIAISFGTIIQKRFSGTVDLVSGNCIQAIAAAGFYLLLLATIETYRLEWTLAVSLAMVWIVLAISLGAISILMLLIRKGQMAATSSLFFMVPPVSALLGYFAFGEALGLIGIAGFLLASAGVWLVNRPEKS